MMDDGPGPTGTHAADAELSTQVRNAQIFAINKVARTGARAEAGTRVKRNTLGNLAFFFGGINLKNH